MGGRENKWERRTLNYCTYAWTQEINILKISSASLKRKQWLDQVARPHRRGSQVIHCGRQPLKRLLPYSPCIIHSRWMWAWARPSDSFLTEKIQHKLMGCHFQDSVTKMLWLPCCSSFLAFSHLLTLRNASCHIVSYTTKGAIWQGTEGCHWPIARQKRESAILPCKNLQGAQPWTTSVELEVRPHSAWLANETAAVDNTLTVILWNSLK